MHDNDPIGEPCEVEECAEMEKPPSFEEALNDVAKAWALFQHNPDSRQRYRALSVSVEQLHASLYWEGNRPTEEPLTPPVKIEWR